MKRQWFTAVVGAVMIVAIGLLWMRVRTLETSLETLTQQLQSQSNGLPVSTRILVPSMERNGQKKIFKLIETAPDSDRTHIGVPWSVERGMMHDAAERARKNPHPMIQEGPTAPVELKSLPKVEYRDDASK